MRKKSKSQKSTEVMFRNATFFTNIETHMERLAYQCILIKMGVHKVEPYHLWWGRVAQKVLVQRKYLSLPIQDNIKKFEQSFKMSQNQNLEPREYFLPLDI